MKIFYMGEAKPLSTPMSSTTALDADEDGKPVTKRSTTIGLALSCT
jgi:hypothetical protein